MKFKNTEYGMMYFCLLYYKIGDTETLPCGVQQWRPLHGAVVPTHAFMLSLWAQPFLQHAFPCPQKSQIPDLPLHGPQQFAIIRKIEWSGLCLVVYLNFTD